MAPVAAGLRRGHRRHASPATGWPSTASAGHELDLDAHSTLFTRRAVQLLGRLRRGLAAEGVPQGHPGRQPGHRDPRGADPRRAPTTWPRSTAGSTWSTTRPTPRSSWPCCSSSCAPPATAGSSRCPASATCSPRPTCTPRRSAATSPARPPGSATALRRDPRDPGRALPRHRPLGRRDGRRWPTPCAPGSTPPSTWCPSSPSTQAALRATYDALAAPRRRHRPAGARRPAPRPDAADRPGLEDRRLRGRAGQAAGRADAARLAVARRRRDAAVLRLRPARGDDDRFAADPADGAEEQKSYRATEWSARNARAFLAAYAGRELTGRRADPARGVRRRQGRLRGGLRGPQPADLGGHPARRAGQDGARMSTPTTPQPRGPAARPDTDPSQPGELDIHLINEGRHEELWKVLGAHADPGRHDASACGRPTPSRSRSPASGPAGTARSTR